MGKGRILSHQGDGLYRVELLEDRVRAEARRDTAIQRITQINSRITDLEADLSAAQAKVDSAAAAQDQAIEDYQAALADDEVSDADKAKARAEMVKAGEAVIEAAAERDAVASTIRVLSTERLALQRSIDRINALPALRQVDAWCADLTEDLSGEVATAEVNAEAEQVLVRPGYEGGAVYDVARDGALQPALSGTPAGVFYNLAMLPGTQKWRPTYRVGTISDLDYDAGTCSLTLDAATSSQQGLNINAQTGFADVPVQYMDCSTQPFEPGDRVLVLFAHDPETPIVVGFESHPQPCCDSCVARTEFTVTLTAGGGDIPMPGPDEVFNDICPDSEWRLQRQQILSDGSTQWNRIHGGAFLRHTTDGVYDGVTFDDLDSVDDKSKPAGYMRELGFSIDLEGSTIDGDDAYIGTVDSFQDYLRLYYYQAGTINDGYSYKGIFLARQRFVDDSGDGPPVITFGDYARMTLTGTVINGEITWENSSPDLSGTATAKDYLATAQFGDEYYWETAAENDDDNSLFIEWRETWRLQVGCRDRSTGQIEWPAD